MISREKKLYGYVNLKRTVLNIGCNVEQTKYVRMYIEDFILVDIWIHWSRVWNSIWN